MPDPLFTLYLIQFMLHTLFDGYIWAIKQLAIIANLYTTEYRQYYN